MVEIVGNAQREASLESESKAFLLSALFGLTFLTVSKLLPPIGIGRAITLGWKKHFMKSNPLSVRKSEISKINNCIEAMHRGSYIVVCGESGYGKTHLINAAMNDHVGVVRISVSPHVFSYT